MSVSTTPEALAAADLIASGVVLPQLMAEMEAGDATLTHECLEQWEHAGDLASARGLAAAILADPERPQPEVCAIVCLRLGFMLAFTYPALMTRLMLHAEPHLDAEVAESWLPKVWHLIHAGRVLAPLPKEQRAFWFPRIRRPHATGDWQSAEALAALAFLHRTQRQDWEGFAILAAIIPRAAAALTPLDVGAIPPAPVTSQGHRDVLPAADAPRSSRRAVAKKARQKHRSQQLLFMIVPALVLLAVFAEQPAMRLWGALQSGHHLAEARAAMERQDFMAALLAVQAAARATPQDPEMLRTGAEVLAGLGAPPDEILMTLSQLEAKGGMTPKMHLMRARAQIQRGDLPAVEQALKALPKAERQSWDAVELEASLLLRQGRANEVGERLQTSTGGGEDTAFRRAVLELAMRPGAGSFPARQVVWQTARGDGKDKLLALTLLSRETTLTAAQAEELLRLTNQAAPPGLRQAVLAQVFRLVPQRKPALIQAEASRIVDHPVEHQVSFLLFLARQQAPQEVLAFLRTHGRTLSIQSPADFTNLALEAYAKLKDWQTVSQKLQTPAAAHLNRTTRSLWTACATHALNPGSPSVLSDLQIAYEAAGRGKDRAASTRVADTAMNLGHAAFAGACYEQTASLPMTPAERIQLLERACHALAESRDTAALRRVVRTLADAMPGHLGHACRAIYLDLLTNQPLEDIIPQLNALESTPTSEPIIAARQKLLWAMIYHRRNQSRELHRELADLEKQISWSPGERAVLAGLLAKAGEPARAFQLVEKLPDSLLLHEEAAFAKMAR